MPLNEILQTLTQSIEAYLDERVLASVLLMDDDGKHLRHGAAPSLPDEYNNEIDGVEIGPAVGSCGTAAFRKEAVYVTDTQADPLYGSIEELGRAVKIHPKNIGQGLRLAFLAPKIMSAILHGNDRRATASKDLNHAADCPTWKVRAQRTQARF